MYDKTISGFRQDHEEIIQALYRQYDVDSLGILESLKKTVDSIIDDLEKGTLMDYSDFFNPVPSSTPEVAMDEIKNKIIHDAVAAFYKKMDRNTAIAILTGATLLKRSFGMIFTEVKLPIVGGEQETVDSFMANWNSAHPEEKSIEYNPPEDPIWW